VWASRPETDSPESRFSREMPDFSVAGAAGAVHLGPCLNSGARNANKILGLLRIQDLLELLGLVANDVSGHAERRITSRNATVSTNTSRKRSSQALKPLGARAGKITKNHEK